MIYEIDNNFKPNKLMFAYHLIGKSVPKNKHTKKNFLRFFYNIILIFDYMFLALIDH